MRFHSLVSGAVALCALTSAGFTQLQSKPNVMRAQIMSAADQDEITTFSIFLPLTHRDVLEQLLKDQSDPKSLNYRHWLTPDQFKTRFGASRESMAKVTGELTAAGLTVTAEHTHSLEVTGPVWAIQRMFGTQLQRIETPNGNVRYAVAGRQVPMPATLAALGAVVPQFGLRPASHVHSTKLEKTLAAANPEFRFSSNASFFYPNDMNEAYQLPSFQTYVTPGKSNKPVQLNGTGTTIGIVISSLINQNDLDKTFNSVLKRRSGQNLIQNFAGNSDIPSPKVKVRRVGRGTGPFNPNDSAGYEASLDTQMSLGTAPGAKETLYDIEDLYDDSIIAGYTAVVDDNAVDVVSSSFGGCELYYTPAYNGGVDFTPILQVYHSIFEQGNAQGITFLASSGDDGALPCVTPDFYNNGTAGTSYVAGVEYPASDPAVTSVGGTNLTTVASPTVDDAKYLAENANYDPRVPSQFALSDGSIVTVDKHTWGSGGGFSSVFAKPSYQYLVKSGFSPYRGVPDVSLQMGGCPGDADLAKQDCTMLPRSASLVWVGGVLNLLIGTSSSSPQFAGVVALMVEANGGRVGNINPNIYALSALQTKAGGLNAPDAMQIFHRNIYGNNNLYTSRPGQDYSPVLGNSTVNVKNFLLLQDAAPAGTPNTPSNP